MSQRDLTETIPDIGVADRPTSAFLTERHRHAIDALSSAYTRSRPLALLIGDSVLAAKFVIRSFLSTLPEDVAVIRVKQPCAGATEFMREVITGIGFQPKDMSLDDLEGVFAMFLAFQRSHGGRTVICVERTQDHDLWVLDKLRELVESERDDSHGLLLVVSGQSGLKEVLHSGPLSGVSMLAGKRIILTPFSLDETKEFIRQRLETIDGAGIDQLFQYRAIAQIQVLGRGIPDAVAELTNESLALAEEDCVDLVTPELVERAHERLEARTEQIPDGNDTSAETVNMNGIKPSSGRLVFHLTGRVAREMALSQGHTLIGRSQLCDMRLPSPIVSRQHALVCHTPDGDTLIDLGSTNGTFVDGYRVTRHQLEPGETISVGDCTIEYVRDHDTPVEAEAEQSVSSAHASVN